MRSPHLHSTLFFIATTCALLTSAPRLAAQTAISTTITEFATGAEPVSSLLQAHDGNFYGITFSGGTSSNGLIYQLTPSGTFNPVYSFTGGASDGGGPAAGLTEGPDGALYGTTTLGGANGLGTIFRFTTAGLTTLHSFDPDVDGNSPYAALTLANDGNLCGILAQGPLDANTGNYAGGAIFSINPAGTYTNLYSFPEDDSLGSFSTARLLQASDGNFWGVTSNGGTTGYGTAFCWSATNGLTVIHNFTLAEGSPIYGLAQKGGGLYGVTFPFYGGNGEVFAITLSSATYNITYTFTGESDGGSPATALYPASDGNLYGTTQSGGTNSDGTFFVLTSGQPTTLLNFPAGTLNTFADATLLEGTSTAFYLPLLFDATPGLSPSSMDGAGNLLSLMPAYTTPPPAPVSFSANKTSIAPSQSTTLAWSLPNAASLTSQQCYAFSAPSNPASSPWSGRQSISGSQLLTLPTIGTYTFALNCGGSQNSSVQITVATAVQSATQTTLSVPASVTQGQSGTLSATVVSTSGPTPTGTIRFIVDGAVQLRSMALTNGTATFTASTQGVSVGSYSIQALYSGDGNNLPSTSAAQTVHVTAALQSTATALSASPQSVPAGQKVAFTATVTSSSGTPSGSVSFFYKTLLIGTAALRSGVASLNVSSSGVPPGTYGVHAVYNGSSTDKTSTSASVEVIVQ